MEKRTVSLEPGDWKIIEAADKNNGGVSATLRGIVREWAALHQALTPVAGRVMIDTKEEYHERS